MLENKYLIGFSRKSLWVLISFQRLKFDQIINWLQSYAKRTVHFEIFKKMDVWPPTIIFRNCPDSKQFVRIIRTHYLNFFFGFASYIILILK